MAGIFHGHCIKIWSVLFTWAIRSLCNADIYINCKNPPKSRHKFIICFSFFNSLAKSIFDQHIRSILLNGSNKVISCFWRRAGFNFEISTISPSLRKRCSHMCSVSSRAISTTSAVRHPLFTLSLSLISHEDHKQKLQYLFSLCLF